MARFEGPDCRHAIPKGRLADVGKADFWRCGVRARDVYNAGDCAGCQRYAPGQAQAGATTDIKAALAPREESDEMPQGKVAWDGPAGDVVGDAPLSKSLAQWCADELAGGRRQSDVARQVGVAANSMIPALTGRGLLERRKPKSRAKAAGPGQAPRPKAAPPPDAPAPEAVSRPEAVSPPVAAPSPANGEGFVEADPEVLWAYIVASGQTTKFRLFVLGWDARGVG